MIETPARNEDGPTNTTPGTLMLCRGCSKTSTYIGAGMSVPNSLFVFS